MEKKEWKADKMVFLLMYAWIYFVEKVYPKFVRRFQALQKFDHFHHYFLFSSFLLYFFD